MTDARERRRRRAEILSTVLLAVAAVAVAWTTAQSARWRGEQTSNATKATAARIESSQASTRAGQLSQIDIALFIQWVDADSSGDEELAAFYRRRFREEFQPAFAAWLATKPRANPKAPLTPFAMPEYRVSEAERSDQLIASAGILTELSGEAHKHANDYLLAVVLFATALFFAGISTKIRSLRQQEVLLTIGWVIFLATAAWTATLPISLDI